MFGDYIVTTYYVIKKSNFFGKIKLFIDKKRISLNEKLAADNSYDVIRGIGNSPFILILVHEIFKKW